MFETATARPEALGASGRAGLPWGWLPEDEGSPLEPDDALRLDDLAPWDVWEADLPSGGLPVDPFADDPFGNAPFAADPFAANPFSDGLFAADPFAADPPPDRSSAEVACVEAPPDEPRPGRAPWERLAGIEDVPPDGMLALVLEQVVRATADDQLLVEVVAAWERVAAWAHLNAALAAGELSRRPSMNPDWRLPTPRRTCVAGDELAMRLGWSRPAANRLVRDGQALDNELLLTAEAVCDGRLDTFKLRTVTDRLADRPGQLAWMVQEAVLEGASSRTPGQLAADIDRALLAVDPEDAEDRLARAAAKRHVCHPRRLPDGMAGIWAVLPADQAVRVDATLDAVARGARALGDPRTLDQLRADTFATLATGQALAAGQAPTTEQGLPTGQALAAGQAPTTGPASRGARAERPSAVDEAGPASRGDPRPPSHDDDTAAAGPTTRDAPVADDDDDTGSVPAGPGGGGVRIPAVRIDVTVALSTLMGLDERPAELTGFGPISAEQARALAAGGVWRRLVTDPLSGRVLDVGRTRYRPPASLAEHVTARDGVCAAPCCGVRADGCDLDHTTEYHGVPANGSPLPGATSAENLGPLSDRCHRLKTDGGFTLTQVAPGVFEWHTPAGLSYRVVPGEHGRTERLTGRPPSRPNPGYPDEPPF